MLSIVKIHVFRYLKMAATKADRWDHKITWKQKNRVKDTPHPLPSSNVSSIMWQYPVMSLSPYLSVHLMGSILVRTLMMECFLVSFLLSQLFFFLFTNHLSFYKAFWECLLYQLLLVTTNYCSRFNHQKRWGNYARLFERVKARYEI